MQRDFVINTTNEILGLDLLQKAKTKDELSNGVQIHGSEEVTKIALGVSCNQLFLKNAIEWGANLCIFHHALDMRTDHHSLPLFTQKRLSLIFKHDLSILGYHYVLDAHPQLGNNAQIIQKLGGTIVDTLFDEWGYTARFKSPKSLMSLKEDCFKLFGREILFWGNENQEIETIGVVSGAGKPYQVEIEEMFSKGVEAFISGETSESTPHKMLESGINYFVCGHYATETFGVKALGDELQKRLDNQVEVKFIEINNPI